MSKFSRWAGRKVPLIEPPVSPVAPVQSNPGVIHPHYGNAGQPLIQFAPMSRPPVTLFPSQVYMGTVPQTDLLVNDDTTHVHSYEELLASKPELAPMAEVDAAALPGFPDGQVTDQWNDRAKYKNGSTDSSGQPKFLEFVRGKYRATTGSIRSAAGMKIGTRG